MAEHALQDLQDAIARNMAAVLSLPSAGMLRHQKSRFLAIANSQSFWMECTQDDQPLIDELINTQKPVGISFKSGNVKSVFTAVVLQRVNEFRINPKTTVCAVRVEYPTVAIKQMQRRLSYRVHVPTDSDIRVDVWRLSPRVPLRDRPSATQRVNAELIDISIGGLGVMFIGSDGSSPIICAEDRLRIQINAPDIELLIEGSMRSARPGPDASKIRTGISFKTMENDLEGRQNLAKLTKIVGELQRMEARRARLGVG